MTTIKDILKATEILLKASFPAYTIWNQYYLPPKFSDFPAIAIGLEKDNQDPVKNDSGRYFRIASIKIDIVVPGLPPIEKTEEIVNELIEVIFDDDMLNGLVDNVVIGGITYSAGELDKDISHAIVEIDLSYSK